MPSFYPNGDRYSTKSKWNSTGHVIFSRRIFTNYPWDGIYTLSWPRNNYSEPMCPHIHGSGGGSGLER